MLASQIPVCSRLDVFPVKAPRHHYSQTLYCYLCQGWQWLRFHFVRLPVCPPGNSERYEQILGDIDILKGTMYD